MVTRKRLRSILTTLGLYVMAALLIGYFGVNAYSGNHGLKAKEDLDQQIAALSADLDRLKPERAQWERRVALLRADRLDPDMLDEQARKLLDDVAPNDLTLMFTWGPKAADAQPEGLELDAAIPKIIFPGNALAGSAHPIQAGRALPQSGDFGYGMQAPRGVP